MVVAGDAFRNRPMLVTGGTGFIGRRLVAELRERKARARVLVRPGRAVSADWTGVDTVVGELTDAASLARACAGMETVLHVAGFAHADAADTPDFAARHWTVNAEGTFRLLDAAAAARIDRFVFLSSVKAAGDPGPRCVDERWDEPPDSPYGRAKRAAEERVLAVGRESGMHVVNLRPALVYGPNMKGNLARLIEAARRGWLPPPPETGNRRSLVHVDDIAQAILLAAAHPAAAGQTYLVTDGQPYSGRELYAMIRRALGRSVPRWAVPAAVLGNLAWLMDGLLGLAGYRDRKFQTALDKLLGWGCYDSGRIVRELGYRPARTLASALAELSRDRQ
jgi:nucleoside-diphosphate-sugar epimerase